MIALTVRTPTSLLLAVMLLGDLASSAEAKSYSSGGGRSYSSSSSSRSSSSGGSRSSSSSSSSTRTASSGGKSSGTSASRSSSSDSGRSSKTFTSSSGKSYGSGSTWSDEGRRGYTAGKSYSASAGKTFSSSSGAGSGFAASPSGNPATAPDREAARSKRESPSSSSFSYDAAAARARKEEASHQEFTRFKEASQPKPSVSDGASAPNAGPSPSYRVTPPPLPSSATGNRRPVYIPDAKTVRTRPVRTYTVFYPYVSRPVVVYRDPYSSFFWWWLQDRSLEERAAWAYHHRYDMDPARYQALVANNQQLEQRVAQLEGQNVPRDPHYAPPDLDRDLMYSDRHVSQTYSNRPTMSGTVAFWVLAVPLAIGAGCFLIWFIFFKRWQPATAH